MNNKIDFARLWVLMFLLIVVASCKTEGDLFVEKLDGGYTLDKMTYKGEDIMPEVLAAMLSFDNKEGQLFKPPIIKEQIGKYEKYPWDFSRDNEGNYLISFGTNHPYFNDDFRVEFKVNYESRQLNLVLTSEVTQIECTRLYIFENFDELKDSWMGSK